MPHRPDARTRGPLAVVAAGGLAVAAASLGLCPLAGAASLPTPGLAPDPPGRSWLTPSVAAGQRWDGAVTLTNTAPVARRVRLYAVDAVLLRGGAFAPGSAKERRAAGCWIRPGRALLALDAGESVRVPVRVRVPPRTAPGRYPGALVAEDAAPPTSDGLRVMVRGALRVYLTVPPRQAPRRPPADARRRTGPTLQGAFVLGDPGPRSATRTRAWRHSSSLASGRARAGWTQEPENASRRRPHRAAAGCRA